MVACNCDTPGRRVACPTLCGCSGSLWLHAQPFICGFILCPFGGFFLPSVHFSSIPGFRPCGFLAGPGWFHKSLVSYFHDAVVLTGTHPDQPARAGGFPPSSGDRPFPVHGLCIIKGVVVYTAKELAGLTVSYPSNHPMCIDRRVLSLMLCELFGSFWLHARPLICGFMLCPFGGFFLPSVHFSSIPGFRPCGFLAGPGWFHRFVNLDFRKLKVGIGIPVWRSCLVLQPKRCALRA